MPSPDALPKPQAPDAELMQPCEPLVDDDGTAGGALRADSTNRDNHIACQWRQGGLLQYIRALVRDGWVTPRGDR